MPLIYTETDSRRATFKDRIGVIKLIFAASSRKKYPETSRSAQFLARKLVLKTYLFNPRARVSAYMFRDENRVLFTKLPPK